MAKFLEPRKLRTEIRSLFEEAENFLLIVSPFIKLDRELKDILREKKGDREFQILLLFGKNDQDLGKSLNSGDLSFFQEFENIEIYYHPDLHAKYYANDFSSIVTSINLHTYSMSNNIEIGVLFERKRSFLGNDDNREDDNSFNYFMELIPTTERIFIKKSPIKTSFFGLFKSREDSRVEFDNTQIIHREQEASGSFSSKKAQSGFCIRSGIEIPFDLSRPFSKMAFDSWSQYGNEVYPEKYCHFSGEKSNGETSFSKPVLRKHYQKAIELQRQVHK